jgi:murein DD-endopeptidase MepM/ murein hydrolase activator NlpD
VTKSKREGNYGNLVEIRHPDGYVTRYGHNKANLVEEGQMVDKGEVIALLGSSGRSSGPHVHLEVHKDGKAVNPWKFVHQ